MCFLLASFSNLFSQRETTLEEYNYMTKGYWAQVAQGLDMKKGYAIATEKNFTYTPPNYEFNFNCLKRNDGSIAGWIVKAFSKRWNNSYYFCIPMNNKELFNLFYTELWKLDEPMTRAFLSAWYAKEMSYLPNLTQISPFETRYLKNGYKAQIENDLDMKKGYKTNDAVGYMIGDNYFQIIQILREKGNISIGSIFTYSLPKSQIVNYIGIPNDNVEIDKNYVAEIQSYTKPFLTTFFAAYLQYTLKYEPIR